jgi:hypothetical protein
MIRIRAVDKTYLIELVRDMPPFGGQRNKKTIREREIKPKLWDEICEKLNFMGKYGNNNPNELHYSTAKFTVHGKKFVPIIIRRAHHVTFTSPTISRLRKKKAFCR